MITLCYAAKGGSGTTAIACLRALDTAGPALVVDIEGDVAPMLGLAEPERPGVLDWMQSDAPMAHLDDLLIEVALDTWLLPARGRETSAIAGHTLASVAPTRWDELVDWFLEWGHDTGGAVIIDAGTTPLPPTFLEQCPTRWLVTRACYLSLRRATRFAVAPTGIVLVDEPGRALGARDIETSLRAPVVATVPWDIRVARSIDAGLLAAQRLPRSVSRSLSKVAA